ncbi:hypothetical protein [Pseudoalteromonas umbrosa]|uniref:hypothetical protein n=1 Tax=Pseudoalteromonas umbrosa TaxID=3048489 RepID=UPI0024C321E2|nr:hypothetical protein [Pseudoalteromonas sp. B95]MDK1290156.1 hypothetical protein [Pseudoalteromonas sp. B95]
MKDIIDIKDDEMVVWQTPKTATGENHPREYPMATGIIIKTDSEDDAALFSYHNFKTLLDGDWVMLLVYSEDATEHAELKLFHFDQFTLVEEDEQNYYSTYFENGQVKVAAVGKPNHASEQALRVFATIMHYNYDFIARFTLGDVSKLFLADEDISEIFYHSVKGQPLVEHNII